MQVFESGPQDVLGDVELVGDCRRVRMVRGEGRDQVLDQDQPACRFAVGRDFLTAPLPGAVRSMPGELHVGLVHVDDVVREHAPLMNGV